MVRTPSFDKNGIKKGAWSPEEDTKLEAYIRRYGHWNWRELPKFAGLQRCGKSCRLRWMNYLRPNVKHGNYTKAEEDLIMELHGKHGNRWSMMATRLPGRTDNEIKNHWHTHLKKRWRAQNSSSPAASSDSSHVSLSGADNSDTTTQKQVSSSGGSSSSTSDPTVIPEDCFRNIQILESCPLPPPPSSLAISSSSGGTGVLFGDTITSSPPGCFFPEFTYLNDLIDPAITFCNGGDEDDLLNMSGSSTTSNSSGELVADDAGMMDIYGELEGVGDEFWTKPFDVEEMSFYNNISSFTVQNNTSESHELLLSSYMTHYEETMVGLFSDQQLINEVYPWSGLTDFNII